MGVIICARRIGGCVKGKLVRRLGNRRSRIHISREIFIRAKKEVQR